MGVSIVFYQEKEEVANTRDRLLVITTIEQLCSQELEYPAFNLRKKNASIFL